MADRAEETQMDAAHMVDHSLSFHSRGPLLRLSMSRASQVRPAPSPDVNMLDPFPDAAINTAGPQDLLSG